MSLGSPVAQRPVAILAYGSLLHTPGPELAALIVGRRPCRTPFPVEYGRVSRRWGGGPVLVPHPRGAPVDGALLLLVDGLGLGVAVEALAQREGLPDARGVLQVEMPGDHLVLVAALPRNLPAPDMTTGALARRAVASVSAGTRNGVAYLRGAIDAGVRTPLTDGYAAEVLALTGAGTLDEAERLVALARPTETEGTDGLG